MDGFFAKKDINNTTCVKLKKVGKIDLDTPTIVVNQQYEYNHTLYAIDKVLQKDNYLELQYKSILYNTYREHKNTHIFSILHSSCIVKTSDNCYIFGYKNRVKFIGGIYEREVDNLRDINDLILGAERGNGRVGYYWRKSKKNYSYCVKRYP